MYFTAIAHTVMLLMAVYTIYYAFYVSALKQALNRESQDYKKGIANGKGNQVLGNYYRSKNKGIVAGFYFHYRSLIFASSSPSAAGQESYVLYNRLLEKPDLINHFVHSHYAGNLIKLNYLSSWGTSLGMLFTILAFVLIGFSENSETTVASSLTALTTTGIGCVIALIADLQKRALALMMNRSVHLIETALNQIKAAKKNAPKSPSHSKIAA